MSLRTLDLKHEYRTDSCGNFVREFYIPCLERSLLYRRAVGFFSSSSLVLAARGLSALVRVGGKMQLVASPHLSAEDADAIGRGLAQRQTLIEQNVIQVLDQDFEAVVKQRLECLAWLLQAGILEIKLAVSQRNPQGIYHEKLGIFTDAEGNRVVFTGSPNESATALVRNFECMDVFCSWREGDRSRLQTKVDHFQRLWMNQTVGLEVLEFPDAARRSLLRFCPDHPPLEESEWWVDEKRFTAFTSKSGYDVASAEGGKDVLPQTNRLRIPDWLTLRSYQKEAIGNWFGKNGRGTLKMATGSGKTITALAIATRLYEYEKVKLRALIIVCPYRHLVNQWARECKKFGIHQPILAFEAVNRWQESLSNQLYNLRTEIERDRQDRGDGRDGCDGAGSRRFLVVITTNATLMSKGFQSQLEFFPRETLIVGDEAHNLGSQRLLGSLPERIMLRLALSATPERYFDDVGTAALFDYFGEVVPPEFTLRDAIEQGALVRYLYYPVLVELTDSEIDEYLVLTRKIGMAMGVDDSFETNEGLTALLNRRARLVGAAANKLEALREVMGDRLDSRHTLFYCGDGSVEEATSVESQRQTITT